MTASLSKEENLGITFESRLVTPTQLAKKLKENEGVLLRELKEEKGIFEDTMTANTILAWDTIQRACERRGMEAIETKEKNGAIDPSEIKDSEKKISLTAEEKKVLQYCRDFHKEYSSLIEKALPIAMDSKSELAEYHKNISNSIESVLNKVQGKNKSKRNVPDMDDLMNP